MNVQYEIQQGIVGVSKPEGKLLDIPFLTLVEPEILVNKSHAQTNLKQDFIWFNINKENIFTYHDP